MQIQLANLSSRTIAPPAPGRAAAGPDIFAWTNRRGIFLPLTFILSAISWLFLGLALLAVRPEILASYHYNQYVIATTHVFTLGWITSVIMGATYQLVPVALQAKLHSVRLAWVQLGLHVIGVGGLVWNFWRWDMTKVSAFGCVLTVGAALFVYNVGRTIAKTRSWNPVAIAIAAALAWFSATVLAGLAIAVGKAGGSNFFAPLAQMHAHAHLGVIGFFLMIIVGVSLKLVPMFALSEIQNNRRATLSLVLLNAGLAMLALTILFQAIAKPLAVLIVLVGLGLYLVEMRAILRARKRRVLDLALKTFLAGLALLVPTAVVGLLLSWPTVPLNEITGRFENAYGLLAIVGVVTLAIVGMLHKILPFLIWYGAYSTEIGRSKVPTLADLYSARLQRVGLAVFGCGLGLTMAGTVLADETVVRVACVVLSASFVLFAVNVLKMLRHLVHPQTQPL